MTTAPASDHADLATAWRRHPDVFRVIRADGSTRTAAEADISGVFNAGREECDSLPARSLDASIAIPEAIDDPHRLAREVLTGFVHSVGPTLAYFRGEFYRYDGTCYRPDAEFKAIALVTAVKDAVDRLYASDLQTRRDSGDGASSGKNGRRDGPGVVPKVSRHLVDDVAQALRSLVAIDGNADAPFWRSRLPGDAEPINIIPAANGLVDLTSERPVLIPHTPRFFSTQVLPYEYDPKADRPRRWLRFLDDLWEHDPESIDSLHEVIGYLLTPDIRFHKMFLMIGPPRSGRSTIREIITALVGRKNVASCSPESLGSQFGLEPLLGKSVAIMADARTGDDSTTRNGRLLRIVGADSVEVDRKHRPILHDVLMRTRFVLVSNELPNFRDASNAITKRYHVLRTRKEIPPEQRDPDLVAKLTPELPGILNLAIEGRNRLNARGRFVQPASAADLIEDAQDIASPVGECVKECFVLAHDLTISKAEAFGVWKRWAEKHGHKPGNSASFGKDLRAAFPSLGSSRPRGEGGKQVSCYEGIGCRAGPTRDS